MVLELQIQYRLLQLEKMLAEHIMFVAVEVVVQAHLGQAAAQAVMVEVVTDI